MTGHALTIVGALGALVCAPAAASATEDRVGEPPAMLTAAEVQKYFEPYVPAVRGCYLASAGGAADGNLRLELIIHPDGSIFRFGFAAPGVTPPARGKLDRCLRALVPSWHFPVRTRFTTAVLPFLFHATRAPGAGPIESCWDPRGCPPGKTGGSK